MRVDVPRKEDDFRTWERRPGDHYAALGGPATLLSGYPEGGGFLPHHEWDYLSVFVLRVVVDIEDAGVGAADLRAAERDDLVELYERGTRATSAARDSAREVVEDIVAWARAAWDQPWLGLSSEAPETVGPTLVVDPETNEPVDLAPPISLHLGGHRDESRALDARGMERLFEAVSRSEPAPLAETFLADAEYLAWEHFPHDPVRAVLMAAIAAEVKVKRDLVDRADPVQRPVIEDILNRRPGIAATPVDGLFDKLIKLAQGRSLREDDAELFKKVRELFRLRNDIAHSGQAPDLATAQDAVRAARRAITWVDGGPGGEPNTITP